MNLAIDCNMADLKNIEKHATAYLVVSSATMLSKFSPAAKQATIQGNINL